MEFNGKVPSSALNDLKNLVTAKRAGGAGGASGAASFTSALEARLVASQAQQDAPAEELLTAQPGEQLPQESAEAFAVPVEQQINPPLTITQDTTYLAPQTADTAVRVKIDAPNVEPHTPGGPRLYQFIVNGVLGEGYYGMDGYGNWGYYADPELTQKLPNGGWDTYRSSDGGPASFEVDTAGRLMPSARRDLSRAGQTVILASGNNAFQVEYTDMGYVKSIMPVKAEVDELYAAQTDPLLDRGVSGRELLLHTEGVSFPEDVGETVDTSGFRAAVRRDWNEIMAERGYDPPMVSIQPEQNGTDYEAAVESPVNAMDEAARARLGLDTQYDPAETVETVEETVAAEETAQPEAAAVELPVERETAGEIESGASEVVPAAKTTTPTAGMPQIDPAAFTGSLVPDLLLADDEEERDN